MLSVFAGRAALDLNPPPDQGLDLARVIFSWETVLDFDIG